MTAPMEGGATQIAPWASTLSTVTRRLRFVIAIALLVATVSGFIAGERLVHDPDVLVYFDKSSPSREAFDALEDRFGRSQEVATLLVAPAGRTVLEPEAVAVMAQLVVESGARAEVTAVRSPLDRIGVSAEAILAAPSGELADIARQIAAAGPADGGSPLVSDDGTVAAVAAIIPAIGDNALVEELAGAHAAIRDDAQAGTAFELIQTGRLVIDAAFLRESRDDLDQFAGLQLGLLLALLFAAFGSLSLTVVVGGLAMASLGLTVGTLSTLQWPVNGISSATPAVLMGLTVASAVHVAGAWQAAIRCGEDKRRAVEVALTTCGKPVALSLGTTMLSFLVLNIAEAPPFRDLGNLVAIGLVGVFGLTFFVLPALLHMAPRSRASHRAPVERMLGSMAAGLAARRRIPVFATIVAAGAALVSIATITVDDTFSHYFDERYEIRRATDLFEQTLSGTTIIDVVVDSGRAGGALSDGVLGATDEAVAWLELRPEVARADSIAALWRELPNDVRAAGLAVLPAAAETAARAGRPLMLDGNAQAARISVVMRGVSSQDTLAFAADTEAALSTMFGLPVAVTGLPVLSAELSVGSAEAMVVGIAVALTAISLIIVVALRSVWVGAVSIIPNLLPVMLAFGQWGVFVGEISFAATVVAALTYGIVVDDTVHILTRFKSLRERGVEVTDAVRETYSTVGVAVVVTTLALALSFLPFAMSGFLVNRHFGALTALTLIAALVVDLLLLPALLSRRQR
ncbi:MAG: MMPL family transporter [Pseudomonadota bacterium]